MPVFPVPNDPAVCLWREASFPFAFQLYGTVLPHTFKGDTGLSHRLVKAFPALTGHRDGGEQCYLVSRSHTGEMGVLLVALAGAETCSVGVDIELQQRRSPSRALIQRISPAQGEYERLQGIPPLGVWCVKEALFKAWLGNAGGVIAQLTIQQVRPYPEVAGWHGTALSSQGQPLQWMLQPIVASPAIFNTPLWLAVARQTRL